MAKLLKIIGRILGLGLEWILIFIIFLAFAIRSSPVQTYLAEKATNYLSNELNAVIKIDKVDIILLDRISLDGILIEDQEGDTILFAETIYASIDNFDLGKRDFQIGEVEIKNANVQIQRDEEGIFNYQFLKEHFTPKKKRPIKLSVNKVNLNNVRFRYHDYRKEEQDNCVDYFHIDGKNINGTVEDFVMENRVYSATVQTLNCVEKSGFILEDIYTEALVTEDGIFLSNTSINSPGSYIESEKFNMLTTGFIDVKHFVDSVDFDGTIDRSIIDLEEAALFAPIFAGMNDSIQLQATLSRKTSNLKISELELKIKQNTYVRGSFNLPDYRDFNSGFFQEDIDYAYIDLLELQDIKLPKSAPYDYVSIDSRASRLKYIEAEDVKFDGFLSQFVIAADVAHTALGDIRIDNGIMFTQNEENESMVFEKSSASSYDVKLEHFNVGRLLGDDKMGLVDGTFFLSGEAFNSSDLVFSAIEGNVNRFDYLDYPYSGITIIDGKYENKIFEGSIDVEDDNLEMTYTGSIDFKGEPHLSFTINVENASLDQLNLSKARSQISSIFTIDLYGKNPNDFRGTVTMDGFSLVENERTFNVPSLKLEITRGEIEDVFSVESEIVHGAMKGKLNFDYLTYDFNQNLNEIFPALFSDGVPPRKEKKTDHFEYNFEINQPNDFLAIFYPELTIAPKTTFQGHYYAEEANLYMDIVSDSIKFKDMHFTKVAAHQTMKDKNFSVNIQALEYALNDSIHFDNVNFDTHGKDNALTSDLSWGNNKHNASTLTWETEIKSSEEIDFILDPSFFFIQDNKWEVAHLSKVKLNADTIHVEEFELIRNDQRIFLDGYISQSDKHRLNFNIQDFELDEISNFISPIPLEGKMNAWGYIADPFHNFQYVSDANIYQFKTDKRLVGDLDFKSEWLNESNSIGLRGNMNYRGHQSLDFTGDFYPKSKTDKLDFNLLFDHTDIDFTNAFMNPEVLSEIKGLLDGTLKVTGTLEEPILEGSVELLAGSAYVDLLGTHFGIEGPIEAHEDAFYINGIPVYDEEGNAGLLVGSIYHSNFTDFNFDIMFDLEYDAINKDPLNPWKVLPLEKFMVLNSEYRPGDLYYGKGYATGWIDIFGYTDNLEITVDLTTQEGTKMDVPMYGAGDIEEEGFIIFLEKDTTYQLENPRIDFTGVDLDLNFHITPDAEVKLIFNEESGDEITTHGYGDMGINLNNIGDVTMNGVYTISDGIYNFVMGPAIKKFYLEEGGSISWSGDPYNAYLDLRSYYKVNANISAATNEDFGSDAKTHEEVLCFLDLSESLLKPTINFDIEAPGADQVSQSVISRIKSDQDELNRQFFSLLLWNRFQPLTGTVIDGNSAALELVANQINSMLAKVSDDYALNVNLESDELTGDDTYEFGVSTGFLDDRLIVSGSFGVQNHTGNEVNEQSFVGDVNIEYLLNESGTFRIHVFNESNDKTLIQNENQGAFTQGGGLYYKEDFHTVRDFKVFQYFLDIFRKKENKRYPQKRKRKQVPVPETNRQSDKEVEKPETP